MDRKKEIEGLKKEIEALSQKLAKLENEDEYFNLSELTPNGNITLIFDNEKAKNAGFNDASFMSIRTSGEYRFKAFYLSSYYNWEIKQDGSGSLVLIPTKQ